MTEDDQVACTHGMALEREPVGSLPNAQAPLPDLHDDADQSNEWDREALRAYMITHSVKGSKIMPKRSKNGTGKLEIFKSPVDPTTIFKIKHVGVREMIEARDDSALTRYVTRDTGAALEYLSEKEFPEGTKQLQTIVRCLAGWNIQDEDGNAVPIDEESVQDYVDADGEFDALYEKCIEINPCLLDINARKRLLKSNPPTTGGSSDGENEPPTLPDDVPGESSPDPEGL